MTETNTIPLSKLLAWEGNVRKTDPDKGIDELASSILAHGLLQSLVVRKDKRGKFAVVAGRRRLLALKSLAEAGYIETDRNIPCHVISRKVDAIVLTPADSKAVGSGIVEANQANIPVFTADIASTAGRGVVVAHIASDNVAGGRVGADLMCKALNGKGTVAIIDQPEVTSVQDRVKGFKDELVAKCPGVTIVADQDAGGDEAKAESVTDNLLQRLPNLSGIFGINDNSALGAVAAVKAAGKIGKIKIVGYDASPIGRKAIDAGEMVGDPQQHPDVIGQLTIDAIHDYFAGKTPKKVIPVPVGAYTGPAKP